MLFTEEIIDEMMTYHNDPDKVPMYQNINAAAKAFVRVIMANTPQCPDQSNCIRVVREARMWANTAIALEGRF
jgi:hypothetical protein